MVREETAEEYLALDIDHGFILTSTDSQAVAETPVVLAGGQYGLLGSATSRGMGADSKT